VGAAVRLLALVAWCLDWPLSALRAPSCVGVGMAVASAVRLAFEAERNLPWTCGPVINWFCRSGNKILRAPKPLYFGSPPVPPKPARDSTLSMHTKVRVVWSR
jgi:hypothetical protein